MSSGAIVRHNCGRLIIFGQRCVCDPMKPFECECTAIGNREHEGELCKAARRRIWNHVVNWSRDRAASP